ncbi:MAG: SRPBCC domain-containing protein [Novosphingobium sp.]
MTTINPHFTVFACVSAPPAEVYEAVADPAQISAYFTTGGAEGRLEPGAEVSWDFADFPGRFPVQVIATEPPNRIELEWAGNAGGGPPGYKTRVDFIFSPLDDGERTKVEVTESGWSHDQAGLDVSYGNCMGWAQMLAALKLWVEHGINLREGMYK